MYCQSCGEEFSSDARFCGSCGKPKAVSNNSESSVIAPQREAIQVVSSPTIAPQQCISHIKPDYGFTVEQESNRITIHVPARQAPDQFGRSMLNGCLTVFGMLVFFPLAGVIGYAIGNGPGALIGLALVGGLYTFILVHDSNKKKELLEPFQTCIIEIEPNTITINNRNFARAHARGWATRWKESTRSSVVAVGQPSFIVAAAVGNAIANSAAQKQAEFSYGVTFDYGNQQVRVAGGMNEAMAGALMETIENSLARV